MGRAVSKSKSLPPSAGEALLAAPEGATSVSWGGETYEVSDGQVLVPVDAISDLLSHGFTVPEEN